MGPLGPFGPIGSIGSICAHWAHLGSFGPIGRIWAVGPIGSVWAHWAHWAVGPIWRIWAHLVPLGPLLCLLFARVRLKKWFLAEGGVTMTRDGAVGVRWVGYFINDFQRLLKAAIPAQGAGGYSHPPLVEEAKIN